MQRKPHKKSRKVNKKSSRKLIHVLGISVLVVLVGAVFAYINFSNPTPSSATYDPATKTYLETFDGNPDKPIPFTNLEQSDWDIAIHSRDTGQREKLNTMQAHHGHDCSAPIDESGNLVTHATTGEYEGAVFKCKDHIMTSINESGYGVIYLTPHYTFGIQEGSTIKFNMSTFRSSPRDWVDLWITPYEDNLQLPLDSWLPDLQGTPKNAIHIKEDNGIYKIFVISNYQETEVTTNNWTKYDDILTPSPKDRALFELTLSNNHIKFGLPEQPLTQNRALYWADTDIPSLNWDQAIIQFGHHSYTPEKDCDTCKANTWHWDNVSISNATPFEMIKSDKRRVTQSNELVTFTSPAPKNSKLRFSAIGTVDLSFDNGETWEKAVRQNGSADASGSHKPEHFSSYFTPIPEGVQNVMFKFSGDGWYNGAWPYEAKDFAIWTMTPRVGGPSITDAPTPTTEVTVAPTAIPTNTPTPSPKPTNTPTPAPLKFSSKTTALPNVLKRGLSTLITSQIKSNKDIENATVIINVYDSSYKTVFEKKYTGQNFSENQNETFTQTWSTSTKLKAGVYKVSIGVYDTSWKTYYWNDTATKITIR